MPYSLCMISDSAQPWTVADSLLMRPALLESSSDSIQRERRHLMMQLHLYPLLNTA